MTGTELSDLLRFLMQAGAAIAGASAFWSFVFLYKADKAGQPQPFRSLGRIASRVFFLSFAVFLASWALLFFTFSLAHVGAHEGITPGFSEPYFLAGLKLTAPIVILMSLAALVILVLPKRKKALFLIQFLLTSIFMAFATFTGEFGLNQIFYSLHGFHSILTLGTVILVDTLYMSTTSNDSLKRVLYPLFPTMSAVIWAGLGIDFLSVGIISPGSAFITTQFIFNQLVVGIIIMNGALLSGRINNQLISLITPERVMTPPAKLAYLYALSGCLSVVSWTTVTFLDFFALPFSLPVFIGLYLSLVAIAFLAYAASHLLSTRLQVK